MQEKRLKQGDAAEASALQAGFEAVKLGTQRVGQAVKLGIKLAQALNLLKPQAVVHRQQLVESARRFAESRDLGW